MNPGGATNQFTTTAVSGAGASNVGVAGSIAVNALDLSAAATINSGFTVTIASGGTGDVSLNAENLSFEQRLVDAGGRRRLRLQGRHRRRGGGERGVEPHHRRDPGHGAAERRGRPDAEGERRGRGDHHGRGRRFGRHGDHAGGGDQRRQQHHDGAHRHERDDIDADGRSAGAGRPGRERECDRQGKYAGRQRGDRRRGGGGAGR